MFAPGYGGSPFPVAIGNVGSTSTPAARPLGTIDRLKVESEPPIPAATGRRVRAAAN